MSKLAQSIIGGFADTNVRVPTKVRLKHVTGEIQTMPNELNYDLGIVRKMQVTLRGQYVYSQQELQSLKDVDLKRTDMMFARGILNQLVGDIADRIIRVANEMAEDGLTRESMKLWEVVDYIFDGNDNGN